MVDRSELLAERDDLVGVVVVLEADRRAVRIQELDRKRVACVRLIPRHLDEQTDSERCRSGPVCDQPPSTIVSQRPTPA